VTTKWVARNVENATVILIEVDIDTTAYHKGHIENAVGWNWQSQLQNNIRRALPGHLEFEELCSKSGISNDSTVVRYGDHENWFAANAFWQFKYFGHNEVRLMNGGRKRWEPEARPLTTEPPNITPGRYKAGKPDPSVRARREHIFEIMERKNGVSLDVRSHDEFTGRVIAPTGHSNLTMNWWNCIVRTALALTAKWPRIAGSASGVRTPGLS
jgi:thiosulfate/3-mercaptopyruvate sulfurtransferase